MSDQRRIELGLDGELEFEHIGTMVCGEQLLIADVEYFAPDRAGTARGRVAFEVELEVLPGVWQLLFAYEGDELRFILLAHERELEVGDPLDQAEAAALLRVDSGRITAIDPAWREDETMQAAVLEAPREQVPCMLRALGAGEHEQPRGAVIDIDAAGVFEIHAPPGRPRTALFLAIVQ